jgi:hypothetical protein
MLGALGSLAVGAADMPATWLDQRFGARRTIQRRYSTPQEGDDAREEGRLCLDYGTRRPLEEDGTRGHAFERLLSAADTSARGLARVADLVPIDQQEVHT